MQRSEVTDPVLTSLWDVQKKFTEKFWSDHGGMPAQSVGGIEQATKDYVIHMIREVTEILDEINWKMHRSPDKEVDISNVLEEMIDVQKFLFGLAQVWGFNSGDYVREFLRKSSVVEQRYDQERDLPKWVAHPVVLVDIDGVLGDWDACFYKFVIADQGYPLMTAYSARVWFEQSPLKIQEAIKTRFRQSGVKATMPLLPGARILLDTLRRSDEIKIVLLTNRPYAEHYRIYPDTLEWLKSNDLPYDAILWARDKGFEAVKRFKNVCWAIDDRATNCKRLREAGVPTVKVDNNDEHQSTAAFAEFLQRHCEVNGTHSLHTASYAWEKHLSAIIEVLG